MNEARQALPAFLQRQQIRYCNPAGVVFYRVADGSLYVAAGYPGVEQTADSSLEFFQQFEDLTQFMVLLHCYDPERLAYVIPADLLFLYEGELLDVVCTLEGVKPRAMRFRKMGGMTWASTTKKKMHQVHIHKPEDYIAYTRQHYTAALNGRGT